jgi:hypothetical protein
MRPQRQRYTRNNATAGEFGDCHRTCIAMILNMHRDDVPHFMDGVDPDTPAGDPAWKRCVDAEVNWLARRGLAPVNVPFPGDTDLSDIQQMMEGLAHDAPFILGCTASNGCNHSVVMWGGRVYNPNNGTIAGPMRDGFWWLTIYGAGHNWRSPRLSDRVRDLFRLAFALAMRTGTR